MDYLPSDVINLILNNLALPDVIHFALVNSRYYELTKACFPRKTYDYFNQLYSSIPPNPYNDFIKLDVHLLFDKMLEILYATIAANDLKRFRLLMKSNETLYSQLFQVVSSLTAQDINYVQKTYQTTDNYPQFRLNLVKKFLVNNSSQT